MASRWADHDWTRVRLKSRRQCPVGLLRWPRPLEERRRARHQRPELDPSSEAVVDPSLSALQSRLGCNRGERSGSLNLASTAVTERED